MVHNRSLFFFVSLAVLCCSSGLHSASAQEQGTVVRMVSPLPHSKVITKHPDIQAVFSTSVDRDSLIILLDDNDITATAEITGKGIYCRVPILLQAGNHTLYIAGNSESGPFEQEVEFSSRQYATVDEAYTNNEWTLNLQAGNFHGNHQDDFTSTSLDSTLMHESVVKKGDWQVSLNGGARLLEQGYSGRNQEELDPSAEQLDAYGPQQQTIDSQPQNQGSLDPERQGLDLNTVLLRTQYQHENVMTALEIGDLQIAASKNTFESLARNGGQLSLELGNVYFNGFSVFGTDTFGVRDGIGIGFDNDDHLNGFSGGVRLLKNRIDVKGFYMDGGRQENSYSSWSQEQGNKGNVYGVVLKTCFFDSLLTTEFEYDRSDFDPNTGDEFASIGDEAYRLQIGGQQNQYYYDIAYEYFGRDYDVPGNLSPQKDYAGITATGSMLYDVVHNVGIMLSGYHDNVDSDPLYARTNSLAGQLDYSYSGFMEFPLGFSYQHTTDQSTDEPEGSSENDLNTDSLTLSAGYAGQGPFTVDFSSSYSWQDDNSDQDMDIATLSFMLSPTLTFDTFSINMSGTLNQNRDMLSGNRTDDYVITLDTMGSLFNEQVSYEFGGTYDHTLVTDNSGGRHGFTGYTRIAYHLPWFVEPAHPSLGIEIQYNSDKPQGTSTTEETRVFCTLSTSVPFSF